MDAVRTRHDDQEPEVALIPRERLIEAISRTVKATGFTAHELECQAKTGEFASDRARLAWGLVKDGRRLQAS